MNGPLKYLIGFLLFMVLAIFFLFAAGLRIHPEFFTKTGEREKMVKIQLNSGEAIVGSIIQEDDRSVRVSFQEGEIGFKRNEIQKIEPVVPGTAAYDNFSNAFVEQQKPSLFTFRAEDSLFFQPPKKTPVKLPSVPAKAAKKALKARTESNTAGGGLLDMPKIDIAQGNRMMQNAQAIADKASQKREEIEKTIKEMEEN